MPKTNRALTRAIRSRAKRAGEPYTAARDAVLAIRELMGLNECSFADAEAYHDDPANKVMCDRCGWTYGMVCPECPGCGCYNYECTGWRHGEYRSEDDDPESEDFCGECGATGYYDCDCYDDE